MTFRIDRRGQNVTELVRRLGYRPQRYEPNGQLNCVRPLGGDYPRFHIYLKEEGDTLVMNLHLDQKRPSYEGSHAHGGDYESETVRDEADRIRTAAAQ